MKKDTSYDMLSEHNVLQAVDSPVLKPVGLYLNSSSFVKWKIILNVVPLFSNHSHCKV